MPKPYPREFRDDVVRVTRSREPGVMLDQVAADFGDRQLSEPVGEFATRSDAFAARCGTHTVRLHRTATTRLHNAVVGDLELSGAALQLPGEDLTLIVYTAPAASPAQEKLDFLTRWGRRRPPRGYAGDAYSSSPAGLTPRRRPRIPACGQSGCNIRPPPRSAPPRHPIMTRRP